MKLPTPRYVVYIDEAGDPGVKQKSAAELEAASEWFVVSAVVIRDAREQDAPAWIADMREAVRAQGRSPIHYRKLSRSNQARVCRMLAGKDVRIFIVASHKTNMRGYQNKRIGSSFGRGEFYNWCLRLLLERVTQWCANRSKVEKRGIEAARIIFSERGGHDYTHLRGYIDTLCAQAETGRTFLKAKEVVPGVLHAGLCDVRPHSGLAGLQLADIAASAFFQGLDVSHRLIRPNLRLPFILAWPKPRNSVAQLVSAFCGCLLGIKARFPSTIVHYLRLTDIAGDR